MYLRDSVQSNEKKYQRLKLSQVLRSTFPENVCLAQVITMIIRSYVYATSVVHATEIHLRSLIGARTCMRVYTNSAELDAQSERGISKSSAEKIYMRIALQKSSTCADRLLDNHVVISEHRKFCYWKCLRSLGRKWVWEM